MKTYEGKGGGTVSPKLDGVYARATKDGVFSKSGNPLDLPHVSNRLKRHFRKNPDSVLEGEVFKKGEGIEKIAGAVRAGGKSAKHLKLHIFPKDGEKRPWSIGAVRRVPGKKAADAAGVQQVFQKALKRGHEGVVVRGADGVPAKLKPKQDAEWEVEKAHGGPRGVLTLKHAGGSFKVQSKPGLTAKAGDKVQVSYSGTTKKGTPKAAVAQRVRNDHDFEIMKNEQSTYQSPARLLLGAAFPEPRPCARVIELARETVEEEIARDRRTLKRIGIGAAVAGGVAATVIHKGRVPKPVTAAPVQVVKAAAPVVKKAVPSYWGKKRPRVKAFGTSNIERLTLNFEGKRSEEGRDGLSKTRDVAVIAGTGAVGAGAVTAGYQARKLRKKADAALGMASSSVARTARQIRETVTPKAVAHEGLKLVKTKAKEKAVEYFPTFTRAAKALKKTVFQTPAQRMGVIEFAVSDQLVTKDKKTYASPLKVAAGTQEAYRRNSNTAVDLPIGDMQVVKAAYHKAGDISKWGSRGGRLAKDAADVITGKPRARDSSGRKKKREWEKGWAAEAAKKALITGGVLAYATGMKRSPGFREANLKVAKAIKDKVNHHLPNTFSTPAHAILMEAGLGHVLDFAKKEKRDDSGAGKAAFGGAVAGGSHGALLGGLSAAGSKQADDYFAIVKRREAPAHDGGVMVAKKKSPAAPFKAKGKFGAAERLARAEHNSLAGLKKTIRNRSIAGGVAGAALLGGASYAAAKVGEPKKKRFETPASAVLIELGARRPGNGLAQDAPATVVQFDEVAADAGWDIRDPRGKSARVFAPGSKKRVRREKTWSEKADNERKLWKAGIVGAGVLAGAAGVAIGRKLPKRVNLPKTGDVVVPFPKRKKA